MQIGTDHVTKQQFLNTQKWRTAAISKIVLSSYLRLQSSDFDHVCRCEFPFREWSVDSQSFALKMTISGAIFKIGNQLYLAANLADLREICIKYAESHADMVYLTKIAIFNGSSRHVKNSFLAFRHIRHSCNELQLSNVFQ